MTFNPMNNVSGGFGVGMPGMQKQMENTLRAYVDQFGSQNLKQISKEMSDDQLLKYVMNNPQELEAKPGEAGQYGSSASSAASATQQGTAASAAATGQGSAAAAAASPDQINMSPDASDSSDSGSYDENDEIPTDEAMSSGQMCGMSDVSGADKAKPYAQQCLGETKAIKKVLENIQKADQDNSQIGGDISQVDGLIQDLSGKLKKGKKAADGNFSNPKDPQACEKELTDVVKRAVDIAANNGVEIEVSEKRAGQLGGGGGDQKQAAPAAKGAKPQAGQDTQKAKADNENKQATQANQQANDKGDAGGGGQQAQAKPFKIMSEPQEVNKEMGLDQVQAMPELAQALEASLDEQIAANPQGGQSGAMPDLSLESRQGSPLAQQFGAIGGVGQQGPGAPAFGMHQGPTQAYQQAAQGGFGVGMPGGMGKPGGMGAAPNLGAPSGLADKMKRLGIDSNKKFNVKMKEFAVGQGVQVQREDQQGGGAVKVGKNMNGATMIANPPALAGVDPATGQMIKLGNIRAADAGKSGIFSATVKDGQPVLNLQSSQNSIQGDVALPAQTKTDQAKVA